MRIIGKGILRALEKRVKDLFGSEAEVEIGLNISYPQPRIREEQTKAYEKEYSLLEDFSGVLMDFHQVYQEPHFPEPVVISESVTISGDGVWLSSGGR